MTASSMWLVVAVLAAAATAAALGPSARGRLRRLEPVPSADPSGPLGPVLLGACGLSLAWAAFGWRVFGWVLVVAVAGGTVAWLAVGTRRRRQAETVRVEVARAGTTLALLLEAGFLPAGALTEAARDHQCLGPAASAVRLGGDVTGAFRDGAAAPGSAGLAQMAAAWEVSTRSGAPLAHLLGQVAASLADERRLADVVAAELSAARTSGRLMACLPFVAIGMGVLVGADPLRLLFTEWLGELLFLAGVVLTCVGVIWTERIAGRAGRVAGGAR